MKMGPIEITVLVLLALLLATYLGVYIYRKTHHITSGCGCSYNKKKAKKFIKAFRKKYPKKENIQPEATNDTCELCKTEEVLEVSESEIKEEN